MKKNQSQDDSPLHQTVAEGLEFKSGGKSIAVEFTDQKLSAHAGSTPFWAWLHGRDWSGELATHTFLAIYHPGHHHSPTGKTTIKLAVPPRGRDWWKRLWEKILSPFPNCNAVENRPAFAG